jgi:protein-tyrosine kinase
MENIRQAVERARPATSAAAPLNPANSMGVRESVRADTGTRIRDIRLDGAHLESNRIVSHDSTDLRSRSFDMLRTQVVRTMDLKGWRVLGVTSPTPGCGKTVTSINLALSIARQPERQVLLVDMDLQRPQIANYLGIKGGDGLLGVLEGRSSLQDAMIESRIGNQSLVVLPTGRINFGSSELMASLVMNGVMKGMKGDDRSRIVVLDLSPILSSDDAIAILPQLDCVLLVAAIGTSSVSDILEANKHLQSADVVRFVLNKSQEANTQYYY